VSFDTILLSCFPVVAAVAMSSPHHPQHRLLEGPVSMPRPFLRSQIDHVPFHCTLSRCRTGRAMQ